MAAFMKAVILTMAVTAPFIAGRAMANTAPSFDCTKAQSDAEKLVCSDPDLAALDREVDRLYQLAAAAGDDPDLRATQRGWIKGRDDCWKASDPKACVETSYGTRIMELRQGSKAARSQDDKGISSGPFSLACGNVGMEVVFIAPEPSYAVVRNATNTIVMKQQISGSGVRYTGTSFDGDYQLWTKGKEASFDQPGQPTLQCQIGDAG